MQAIIMEALVLVSIIFTGMLLKKAGVFEKQDYKILTKTVMNLTLPAAVITSFSQLKWEYSLLTITIFALLCNLLMQICAYFLSRKRSRDEKIYYMLNMPGYSIGTFAMPFVQSLLGAPGMITASMFDAGNSIMCSGGSYACTCMMLQKNKEKSAVKLVAKKLASSVPFLTYVTMIFLTINGMQLPEFILKLAAKISLANPFICMLMIGIMFELHIEKRHLKSIAIVLGARLLFSIVMIFLIIYLIPLPLSLKKVLAVIVCAPIGTISLVFTDKCKGNTELSALSNSLSIMLSTILMVIVIAVLKLY